MVAPQLADFLSPNTDEAFYYSGSIGPSSNSGVELRQWSSFIGIVTAIIGNILISFALNVQRYAHLRLEREHDENTSWKRGKKRSGGVRDYGTREQEEIADERTRANLVSPTEQNGSPTRQGQNNAHFDIDADENDHLKQSFQSDHTLASSEKSSNSDERKSYLRSPYWWLGIILMTVGETGNFLAYGFAPASIVSPLGVVALISNCVIAPIMLKERFRQRDFWGVVIAIAGAVTVVLSAKTEEEKMGPHDVWNAISRWEFELYLGITAALIVALMWASGRYGDRSILIDIGLVGLFGGYTALSTKGVASLLSDTLWRTLTFPITYLLVFILVLTALMQIRYINRALQRFDSTQVIPTQFVMFTLSVIIGSTVLYRDFESATAERVLKFVGGCFLTFLGVYLITSGRSRGDGIEDEEYEEEETIGLVDEEAYQERRLEDGLDGDRVKRNPAITSSFDGQALSIPSSRHSSRGVEGSQSSTARRPRTPSPSRRVSVAFEETPSRSPPDNDGNKDGESLLSNPWMTSQERLAPAAAVTLLSRVGTEDTTPPPLTASVSTPLVNRLEMPLHRRTSSRPHSPSKADPRHSIGGLSRQSISSIFPGPLISPLSSSLSAVVADSLRRGVGMNDGTPSRRRGPRLPTSFRRSKSSRAMGSSSRDDRRGSDAQFLARASEDSSGQIDPAGGRMASEGTSDKKRRMRSFSDALGWLRSGESRKKRKDNESEDGPAGDEAESTSNTPQAGNGESAVG